MHNSKREHWLATGLAALCLIWLAGWLPHYLRWPWWIDLDTYAWVAQGWTVGRLPYRDVVVFNAPGQIYLFLGLGSVFGWGHTAALYAADASLLGLLCVGVCWWSRRELGKTVPGLLACVMILAYYLDQDYRNVAQRDWHGPLLAAIGLLVLQATRCRKGLILAAIAFAAACVVRPHVVLLFPAYLVSLSSRNPSQAIRLRGSLRTIVAFLAIVMLTCALAALPFVLGGALGGAGSAVKAATYGTRYAQMGKFQPLDVFAWQLGLTAPNATLREPVGWFRQVDRIKLIVVVMCSCALLFLRNCTPRVRFVRVSWVVAAISVLAYAPLHPMRHLYLAHPLRLVVAVNLALVAAWLLDTAKSSRSYLGFSLVLTLVAAMPGWPRFWDPLASAQSLSTLWQGTEPVQVPLGAADHFAPGDQRSPYTWRDYRAALAHLRSTTQRESVVFNLLRNVPFPAINGPIGRPTLLDAEGGIAFLYLVNPRHEAEFAKSVASAPAGSVVVCDFDRESFTPDLTLPILEQAVNTHYTREAQFGSIEIWRKK